MVRWFEDRWRWETTLRLLLGLVVAFSLAVAGVDKVVPPSFAFLLGVMSSSLFLSLPKLVYTSTMIYPVVFMAMLLATAVATMLLALSAIDKGLGVVAFCLWSLWSFSLYFGKLGPTTSGLGSAMITMPAMLALNVLPLVENGLQFDLGVPTGFSQQGLESALCGNQTDCAGDGSFDVTIPDFVDSPFASLTISVTLLNGSLAVDIPGGLWVVRAIWTESGTSNSLAIMRNFFIAFCWVFLCMTICIVLPFPRNMQGLLQAYMVPATIQQTVNVLESTEPLDTGKRQAVNQAWNTVAGGSSAMLLGFEPRICQGEAFVYRVPAMSQLLNQSDRCMLAVVAFCADEDPSNLEEDAKEKVNAMVSLLQASSTALTKNSTDSLGMLDLTEPEKEWFHLDRYGYLHLQGIRLASAVKVWLTPTYPVGKEKLDNAKQIYLKWIIVPLVLFLPYLEGLARILHPQKWSFRSILWAIKRTVGFVALYAMTAYWDKWANFEIENNFVYIGGVFAGWHLASYAFAFMITVEGTVKKGFQRALGTCMGGLAGWLGVVICSGSLDDSVPLNPYGVVVWLLFSTLLAFWLATDPGQAALRGTSPDRGYTGVYFATVTSLVVLDAFIGKGPKGEIVLNRVVATLTGVLMAMIIAIIPPHIRGGDPQHARLYYNALSTAHDQVMERIREQREDGWDTCEKEMLDHVVDLRKRVLQLCKDASQLRRLPFLRVDERLHPLLEDLALTEALVRQVIDFCAATVAERELWETLGQVATDSESGVDASRWIESILRRLNEADAILNALEGKEMLKDS